MSRFVEYEVTDRNGWHTRVNARNRDEAAFMAGVRAIDHNIADPDPERPLVLWIRRPNSRWRRSVVHYSQQSEPPREQ